jgi:hypothetical protein
MQALASLSYLPDYLDSIQAGAEVFDVATPATDALRHLLLGKPPRPRHAAQLNSVQSSTPPEHRK